MPDMKKFIALVMLLGWGAVLAAPITIDFEYIDEDANPRIPFYPAEGFEDEFKFGFTTGDGGILGIGANHDWGGAGSNGTGYLTTAFVSEMLIGRSSQQLFDLHSLDIADVADVIGTLQNGDTITMSLALEQATWTTVYFGSEWSNLVEVQLLGTALGVPGHDPGAALLLNLDNVIVSAVPIPAAVWLFGSALAGLGWMRRRQTA